MNAALVDDVAKSDTERGGISRKGQPIPAQANRFAAFFSDARTDPVMRNTAFLIMGSVSMMGFGFIFWVVAARLFPANQVGLASAAFSLMSLVAIGSKLGLDVAIVRHLPRMNEPRESAIFTRTAVTASTLGAVVISTGCVVGISIWAEDLRFLVANAMKAASFVLLTATWSLGMFVDSIFIARGTSQWVFVKSLAYNLFRLPLPLVLGLLIGSQAYGIFASAGVAMGLALLIVGASRLRGREATYLPSLRLSALRDVSEYAGSTFVAGLAVAAVPLLFPVLVVALAGPEENAYFYVAWQFASLLLIIPTAMAWPLLGESSRNPSATWGILRRSIRHALILILPSALLMVLLSDPLLRVFGASYAKQGTSILSLAVLGSVPAALVILYLAALRARDSLRELLFLSVSTSLLSLGAGFAGLKFASTKGLIAGWLAVQVGAAIYVVAKVYGPRTRKGT